MKKRVGKIFNIDLFAIFYTSAYASLGALFPLIGQYLAGIGFSGAQIGLVTAMATAMGIFANPFWGAIYHRYGRSKKLILSLCLLTAVFALPLLLIKSFLPFLLIYMFVFFFENAIFPLLDATTIEANHPFGAARKWGAVGYAIGVGVTGWISDAFGLAMLFPLFSLFFLITAFSLYIYIRKHQNLPSSLAVFPKIPEESLVEELEESLKGKGHFRDLFRNKAYLSLLLGMFFICGPCFAHNVYFSFLYIGQGGSIAGMGAAMLLMALSEAPFMAWSAKLSSRFSLERMILISMIISALRYVWYASGPAPLALVATFFIQGFVNGVILVETMKYIEKLVGSNMISLAIPLYTALASNCGTIVCQLLGGVIVEEYGGRGVYLFFAVFHIVGLLVYVIAGLYRPRS